MIEPTQINELRPAADLGVQRLLGIDHHKDPGQSAARMVRAGQVPHVRIGRRIRFSIPALQRWAADRLAASGDGQQKAQGQTGDLQIAA